MYDERMRAIINNIKTKRLQLNYSQEYMAYQMGIGQNCYSKIELGYNRLTVERLLMLCEILEMDVTDALAAN
jgi:transcriptional regulator with XRE-family HTH domain